MLDSTFELISLAASNSLAVFCFCNLIIAILLVGSSSNSKPSSQINEEEHREFPNNVNRESFKKNVGFSNEKANVVVELEEAEEAKISSVRITVIEQEDQSVVETEQDIFVDDDEEEEEEEDQHDHDDELRRRVEEFIEKTNRGWTAEKLKTTYALGH